MRTRCASVALGLLGAVLLALAVLVGAGFAWRIYAGEKAPRARHVVHGVPRVVVLGLTVLGMARQAWRRGEP